MARLPVDWFLWAPVRRNIRAAQCRMSISTVKSYLQSSAGRSRLGRPAAPNLGGTCRTHGDRCRSRRRPSAVGSGARGAAVALDRRDDGGDELQENKQIPAPALCRALRTEVSARTGFVAVSDGSFRRCCMRRTLRAACCNDVFRMWHSACCISNGAFHFPCCISHVVRFMLHLVGCALCVARCTHWSTRNVASEYAMSHMRFMTCSTARRRPAVSVGPGVPHGVAATGHNQITFRGCPAPVQMRVG